MENDVKNILVTGGCGFIGSNFINMVLKKFPSWNIINIDKLTYAADSSNVDSELIDNDNYMFKQYDITNQFLMDEVFQYMDFDVVVNFCAESHVDNSISGPRPFMDTNVVGTFNLLESMRKYSPDLELFLQIGTDEVYGSLSIDDTKFNESTPYLPSSPYSASKASADHFALAYNRTFGLPVIVSHCSNNYGPRQHKEKLIPVIIKNALEGSPIPIYGNGTNVRDWIFVDDHCEALLSIIEAGTAGSVYNIGGDHEINNLDLCYKVCELLNIMCPKTSGKYSDQITFVQDRAGHDFRYAIDFGKIFNELGWLPRTDITMGLTKTIDWYLRKNEWWRTNCK